MQITLGVCVYTVIPQSVFDRLRSYIKSNEDKNSDHIMEIVGPGCYDKMFINLALIRSDNEQNQDRDGEVFLEGLVRFLVLDVFKNRGLKLDGVLTVYLESEECT